ncbi:MAG: ABC transporter substrate-binding protein [Limnochordia bacterium]|jgi:multiple sugar transport system substrate-binding protein
MAKALRVACMATMAIMLIVTAGHSAAPVTVTIIAETRDASFKWQTEMIQKFEAAHPNITVDIVSTAGSGLGPKMQTMLAGGAPLDIGFHDPYFVVDWGKQGLLEDLTPFVTRERQYRDWYPAALDLYRTRNALYGLPQDLQLAGIFYNKDHYEEAGLPFPKASWTYEDLRTNAINLKRVETDGTVSRHGFKIPTSRNYIPVIWAHGGDLFDNWADPTEFIGNTPQVRAAMAYLAELVAMGAVQDKATHGRYSVNVGLRQQVITMGMTNTVVMATGFQDITEFDWDVAPLPTGPAGRVPYINGIGWMLFSSSKCKDEAFELLRFLTSPEALQQRVEMTGLVPPSAQVLQRFWLSRLAIPAGRSLLLQDLDKARSPWPLHADLFRVADQELLAVIWGEKAISSALQLIEDGINALLR